jgi:hypothetical protein
MSEVESEIAEEDWFNRGKEDALAGQSKQPPEDPEQASSYDLGYSEGSIQQSLVTTDDDLAEQPDQPST